MTGPSAQIGIDAINIIKVALDIINNDVNVNLPLGKGVGLPRLGNAKLFIEQNVQLALGVSHRGYLLESGRMVAAGASRELLESDMVRKVYLGI